MCGELGGTPPVILLMQKVAGLDRKLRRAMAGDVEKLEQIGGHLDPAIPKAERNAFACYLNPFARAATFWQVAAAETASVRRRVARVTYARAVDYQLLRTYEPEFLDRKFDERALTAMCSEWPAIQRGLLPILPRPKEDAPFGVFMLWARIEGDLRDWENLNPTQRTNVGHAAFALSSIGMTDWFVDQARAICPELGSEFSSLVAYSPDTHDVKAALLGGVDVAPHTLDGGTGNSSAFANLLDRLDVIADELRIAPTRDTVEDLAMLAREFEAIREELPSRENSAAEKFEAAVSSLKDYLHDLSTRNSYEWMDPGLLDQIGSRWYLVRRERSTQQAVAELADDAAHAIVRTEKAVQALDEANANCRQANTSVEAATADFAQAVTFSDKAVARRRLADEQQRRLDADRAQNSFREQLVDAASPFAEPYDYSCDYAALLARNDGVGTPDVLVGQVPATTSSIDVDSVQGAEDAIPAPPQPKAAEGHKSDVGADDGDPISKPSVDPIDSIEPIVSGTVEVESRIDTVDVGVAHGSIESESLGASPSTDLRTSDVYSAAAGDLCRPIWQALAAGHPELAFQVANWIADLHPEVRTPPRDLLASVALADHISLPDGPVQADLRVRYEAMSPEMFAAEAPPSWHAAINLLLVAATLRPMILAPSTGAGSIAQYLHQDGNYSRLYELVQSLRDLSTRLIGFRVSPTVLRRARGEAALRADMKKLQDDARDWLAQAKNYTIKFQAATNVWRRWLLPGELIDSMLAPVVHNRVVDAQKIREMVRVLSDANEVARLVWNTDRNVIKRRHGDEIHAGAMERIQRNVSEALQCSREWLALVDLQSDRGDRARELLENVSEVLHRYLPDVNRELSRPAHDDIWGLVDAAQRQTKRSLSELTKLFDDDVRLAESEPSAAEILGRPLLLLPDLCVTGEWSTTATATEALQSLVLSNGELASPKAALEHRLARGDVLGAQKLVDAGYVAEDAFVQRQECDRWAQIVREKIASCRRSVEIGSAYGYVVEGDRRRVESELSRWESQLGEIRNYDVVLSAIGVLEAGVDEARDAQVDGVRAELSAITPTDTTRDDLLGVEKALTDGDIATANEYLHWVRQGIAAPIEPLDSGLAKFASFFPDSMRSIAGWLSTSGKRRDDVLAAIRRGDAIPGADFSEADTVKRERAAEVYAIWCDMLVQERTPKQPRLESFLHWIGFTVTALHQDDRVQGREIWSLDAVTIADRVVCPIPQFGSSARGRYRMLFAWGRPTIDDLMQWVGDAATAKPAVVLYFGIMSERDRRDLSRQAKLRRRSLVVLDQSLLVYLLAASGSHLATFVQIALPFSYASPYDPTAGLVPPEMFYGRARELDALKGLSGGCFIFGGRQLGKTALLKRAEQSFHAPKDGRYAVWIDLRAEGIGVSVAPGEIWAALNEKATSLGIIGAKGAASTRTKKHEDDSFLNGARDFLKASSDRRILLLLDEADRFFEQDGRADFKETRRLKQLMDDTQRRFKVVFAGLHNVLRMTELANHPLAHFGEPIEIGPLREGSEAHEAAALIRRPMSAAGFQFESRRLVLRILAQTNYYPSLIQLYCKHLLVHMLERVAQRDGPAGPCYPITDSDVEQVYSSEALRDEIRAKFRLTLQLDPRYEVLAYAIAFELLRSRSPDADGMSWQQIRETCAMAWWPDGFSGTSESDFPVLLDEMVGLGVLRRVSAGSYALRNSNVLLLLGTQDEIETVLMRDREQSVEFQAATFRPPARKSATRRSAFTYQQLSTLLQRGNTVSIAAGTLAAGFGDAIADLESYQNNVVPPVVLATAIDRRQFGSSLQTALASRSQDEVTLFAVPDTAPWSLGWLREAQEQLHRLVSNRKFASVVFFADPITLWRLIQESGSGNEAEPALPWMSFGKWKQEFLRHWLDERQLSLDPDERSRVIDLTGLWPSLIQELAGQCTEVRALKERIDVASKTWFTEPEMIATRREQFGLNVPGPMQTIDVLAKFGEPVHAGMLGELAEVRAEVAADSLRWGELLGLTQRSSEPGCWTVDRVVAKILCAES
ncbi:MAG: hypothetical protein BGP23_08555 [Lysobacterales bacterium 66-474]|nr:MAG: hypothetical protein BGP23_08555 [Xanthomonadales bacterium 66-474]